MKINAQVSGTETARRELLRIGAMPKQALAVAAEGVEEYVAEQAARHNQTGALVQSVYLRRAGEAWDIGHDGQRAPHALFVHWGTRPHKIAPKKKGVLRWGAGGIFHFARSVNHPGNKPDPWMTRAAALAPRLFDQHVQQQLARQQGN